MEDSDHTHLLRLFRDMPDQRMPGKVIHKLHDILVVTVCVVKDLKNFSLMTDKTCFFNP